MGSSGGTISSIDAPSGIHFVPAAYNAASGDYILPVTVFKDSTGNPTHIVFVAVLTTSTIAVIEYKRFGNSWVLNQNEVARDNSITLNSTAASQSDITAFAIDDPVGTGDRVLFVATNDASQTPDTFEMDSIILTDGSTGLTAVACVIAGANQPSDTDGMATTSIPLSTTRVMSFFTDDAHFADVTETTGTYTFTYTDAKVLAVDTDITTNNRDYSGILIGSQVFFLIGSAAPNVGNGYELTTAAVLTEKFADFHAGLSGSHAITTQLNFDAITAIGGNFAVVGPVGGGDAAGDESAHIIVTFPLDDL